MGIFYALISAVTYGMIPLFTLPLLAAGISADTALVYRFSIAAAAMGLIMVFRRENFAIGMPAFAKIAGLSIFYMLAVLLFFRAFSYLPSGLVATLQFLYPVMVMLIMVVFFHERFSPRTFAACILAVLGVVLLSFGAPDEAPPDAVWTGGSAIIGIILSLLAGLFNGLYFIAIKVAKLPKIDGMVMTFYVMVVCTALCVANAACRGALALIASPKELAIATMLALVTAVFSNLTLIYAVRLIGPTLASIFGVMEPVTAMLTGILVFGEPITTIIAAGCAVIAASVLLALKISRHEKPQA